MRKLLVLIALLVALPASADCYKKGACGSEATTYLLSIDDASVATTSTDQNMVSFCWHNSSASGAAFASAQTCEVPVGVSGSIRKISYAVSGALGATESCKLGLSKDTGSAPRAFEAWSATDVGPGTTKSCTSDDATGALDAVGESCMNESSTGTTLSSGDVWYVLIDESDTGTPSCTTLRTVQIMVWVDWD